MKFALGKFFLNIIVVAVALFICIPQINLNIGEYNLNIPFVDKAGLTGISQFDNHYKSSRDFEPVMVYRIHAPGLEQIEEGERDTRFESIFQTVSERLKILGISDYSVRKIKTEDNKYFIEIGFPKDNTEFNSALSLIASTGNIQLYQDIPNFEVNEDDPSQQLNFTLGKEPSRLITLDDVQSVTYMLKRLSDTQVGYVVRLNFGDANRENISEITAPTQSTEVQFRGLQLVQQDFPLAFQASPVLVDINNIATQPYIDFVLLGDSANEMQARALVALLTTSQLESDLEIAEQFETDPIFNPMAVEYLKILIPLALIITALVLIAVFKIKGGILAYLIAIQFVLAFAIAKFMQSTLDMGLILGIFIGTVITAMTLVNILYSDLVSNTFNDQLTKLRWGYLKALILFLAIIIFWTQFLPVIMLSAIYGALVSVIAGTYIWTVAMNTVPNRIFPKLNN